MKIDLLLIIILFLISCSSKKQLHETVLDSSRMNSMQYEKNDSAFYQLTQKALLISHEQSQELTWIIPSGPFTYTPASGFRGEAKEIRVFRSRDIKQQQADSSVIKAGATRQSGQASIQKNEVKQRQTDERKRTDGFSVKPWGWLVVGLLLAGVMGSTIRRMR